MAIIYTNYKGQIYYLCQVVIKSGKLRYYFANEPNENLSSAIPEGYEIQESINGMVSLIKIRPKLFSAEELAAIDTALNALPKRVHYRKMLKAKELLFYERLGPKMIQLEEKLIGDFGIEKLPKEALFQKMEQEAHLYYQFAPVLRITITDSEKRLFSAERMPFLNSRDNWLLIASDQSMERLATKLIPLLGTDLFFELYQL